MEEKFKVAVSEFKSWPFRWLIVLLSNAIIWIGIFQGINTRFSLFGVFIAYVVISIDAIYWPDKKKTFIYSYLLIGVIAFCAILYTIISVT